MPFFYFFLKKKEKERKNMNKKNLVIILGLIILGLFLFQSGLFNQFFAFTGFENLSVSNVTLDSSNGFFSGKAIQATFSATGKKNQSYFGELSENTINQSIFGDETVERGFKVSLENVTASCEHSITKKAIDTRLYSYGVKYKDGDCYLGVCFKANLEELTQECQPLGEIVKVGHLYSGGIVSNRGFCLYRNQTSISQGTIQTIPSHYFNANVVFQIDGQPQQTKTIGSALEDNKVFFGEPVYAYVSWLGNLSSGESCESPIDKQITTIYKNGWIITSQPLIDQTKSNESILINNASSNPTQNQIEQGVSVVNTGLNYIYNGVDWKPLYSDEVAVVSNPSLTSGRIGYELSELLQAPVFVMYVKADSLGIHTAVPEPRINYIKGTTFRTGGTGSIEVNVTNIGETGSFEIGVECNNPAINQRGLNLNQTFYSNIPKSVFVPVTGSCSTGEIIGQCRAVVSGLFYPKYSNWVNVTCSPNISCPAGRIGCIDNRIWECSADGTIDSMIKDCTALGQVCGLNTLGELDCVSEGEHPPIGVCPNFWEQYKEIETPILWGLLGTETTAGCYLADWVYLAVFFVIVIIGMFLFFGGKK